MEGRLSKEGTLNTFISSCRETLLNFLNNHFPVIREFAVQPGVVIPSTIQYDEWSLKSRNMLIQFANQLQLPDT